jgi:hypothetical protein
MLQSREKTPTAIDLGPATPVRDYADVYTLASIHALNHRTARQAPGNCRAPRDFSSAAIRRRRHLRRAPAPDLRPTTPRSAVLACSFRKTGLRFLGHLESSAQNTTRIPSTGTG